MDMHDFVSGGGLYKTEAGYSAVINTIKVKSGNTYPLGGYIMFTNTYAASANWDANGIIEFAGTTNASLNLLPVFTITNYAGTDRSTLDGYSNTATWNAQYNIINYDRMISY